MVDRIKQIAQSFQESAWRRQEEQRPEGNAAGDQAADVPNEVSFG